MAPRIIHMMHFPWDGNQRPKADENDFDHGPVAAMRAYAPGFEVKLWTFSAVRELCRERYPDVWAALENVARPVMRVDVLRWVVVHRFGGIYWQMNATPLRAMEAYLPAPGKSVRLFTEFELTPEKCRALAAEPIRGGEPEEPVRVLIQAFAAEPGAAFVEKTIDFLVDRVRAHEPRRDYDVLYITGNAAISTAYDRFGKSDESVERIGLDESRRMLKWHYRGSWRTDAPPAAAAAAGIAPAPKLDRVPALAAAGYRWLRMHPHEALLRRLGAERPRTSCLPALLPWIERAGIRRVCEAPCGRPAGGQDRVEYLGGDPDRELVRENRRHAPGGGARFAHVNLLYTRFPPVDLFICPDFLEWLSFAEARRAVRRILATARPRYLALTGYRWLNDRWDTAFGDFRPIDYRGDPFRFPEPEEIAALAPLGDGRPDRSLLVWDGRQLAALQGE